MPPRSAVRERVITSHLPIIQYVIIEIRSCVNCVINNCIFFLLIAGRRQWLAVAVLELTGQ